MDIWGELLLISMSPVFLLLLIGLWGMIKVIKFVINGIFDLFGG